VGQQYYVCINYGGRGATQTFNSGADTLSTGTNLDGSLSLSADSKTITFTPTSPYPAGHHLTAYGGYGSGLYDWVGRAFSSNTSSFTVGNTVDTTPPTIVLVTPANGAAGIGANNPVTVTFSKPMNRNSLVSSAIALYTGSGPDNVQPTVTSIVPTKGSGNIGDNAPIKIIFNKVVDTDTIGAFTLSLMNGSTALPFYLSFGTTTINGNTASTATLTPQGPLPDGATITFSLSPGITDLAGQAIAPQTITFQTMNGPDFSSPQVISTSLDGADKNNVPVNSAFTFIFNKPLDPTSVLAPGTWLHDYTTGTDPAASVTLSADGTAETVTPAANLTPGQHYVVYGYGYDLNGNGPASEGITFFAGSTTDTTSPQPIQTTPVANQPSVALNTLIEVEFNKPLNDNSLGQVTLTTAGNPVPITASLQWSGTTVRLTPSALLQPSTTFQVNLMGVTDVAGNVIANDSFSFITGADVDDSSTQYLSTTVSANGGVQTQLVNNMTNVDKGTSFVVAFGAPVEAASIVNRGVWLVTYSGGVAVPASVSMSAGGKTATLIPLQTLNASTQYSIYISYSYGTVYDAVGNTTSASSYYTFTTGP